MPQDPIGQITLPAKRVNQTTIGGLSHRINRQIAALEILLQTDIGGGMKHKAPIPGSGFALRAGEGVFLAGLRMQKNREILTDGLKARLNQLFRPGTDHDPVAISALEAK